MRIAISIGAVAAALLLALAAGREGPALAQPADVHDAVVLAVKSLRVTIPAGKPGAVKRARVKVLNADRDGTQTIRLEAVSVDCAGVTVVGPPDFGGAAASSPDTVSLAAGRIAAARLLLEIGAPTSEPSSYSEKVRYFPIMATCPLIPAN